MAIFMNIYFGIIRKRVRLVKILFKKTKNMCLFIYLRMHILRINILDNFYVISFIMNGRIFPFFFYLRKYVQYFTVIIHQLKT